jgi:hypothetical protein
MSSQDLEHATDPDIRGSLAALRRAVKAARLNAIRSNTNLIFWEHGKIVRVSPDDLVETEQGLAYRDEIKEQP